MLHRRPETLLVKNLRLLNVRGFKEADISFAAGDAPRMMTLLVGSNGSGKSTLLRALAIGLCQQKEASNLIGRLAGEFLRVNKQGNSESKAEIHLELADPADPEAVYSTQTVVKKDESGQEILTKTTFPREGFPWESIFVCGYGVNRGAGKRAEQPPSTYRRSDALASLFDDNATLLDPEDTLRVLKLASLDGSEEAQSRGRTHFKRVETHLKQLLGLQPAHRLEVSSKEVRVHGPWGGLPFHALGDGYRGTSGWFLDLCRRAHIADRLPNSVSPSGLVLIDEIDEHLHPEWQRRLIPMLRKRFPKLQFVGTTHSAMSIVNCHRDEILICILKDTISRAYSLEGPEGKTADAILRGQWFGLASTLDNISEKILDSYQDVVRQGRPEHEIAPLREAVRERLGNWVDSPIDELALRIAAEVRRQAKAETPPEVMRQRIVEAARRLRTELATQQITGAEPRGLEFEG